MPPRSFSDETLLPTTDWVKVGPGGRIEAFTMVYEKFNNLPEPPYAFGYVLLDGADTALGGYFKGIDLTDPHAAAEKLKIGTRVTTTFAPNARARCSISGSKSRRSRQLGTSGQPNNPGGGNASGDGIVASCVNRSYFPLLSDGAFTCHRYIVCGTQPFAWIRTFLL